MSCVERYFIKPPGIRCVSVKEELKVSASVVDVFQVSKSQLGKFLQLTCPHSEFGEMKIYHAGESLFSFSWETLFSFLMVT